MDLDNLIVMLRRANYCLVTDDEGKRPLYDESGNLLVCKLDSGEMMSVPNKNRVRQLYDLPEIESKTKYSRYNVIERNENSLVWLGQRSEKCSEATKLLIKLVSSSKYRNMMNNTSIIKLKVWEMIAAQLASNGYRVAHFSKEAGLRTFQKWRNLERTYWKFIKDCASNEFPKKRKPFFIDDMHVALTKQRGYAKKLEIFNGVKYENNMSTSSSSEKMEQILSIENNTDSLDTFQQNQESLPEEVVTILLSLAYSKYKDHMNSSKVKGISLWEHIYDDVALRGYDFASSRRYGALKLRRKWNVLSKHLLGKQKNIQKNSNKIYLTKLRKLLLIEQRNQNMNTSPHEENSSSNQSGKLSFVQKLLTLIDSEKYNKLSISNAKMTWVWEKIYSDMEAMGFYIAGNTLQDKSQTLFEKWKKLKQLLIKYLLDKRRGLSVKKPPSYSLLLKVVCRDMLGEENPAVTKGEKIVINSPRCVSDHDYGYFVHATDVGTIDVATSSVGTNDVETSSSPVINHNVITPGTSDQSDFRNILLQIKSLHKSTLAAQQNSLLKIVSLLEEQVKQQNTLNSLFTQYVTNISRKSKSESRSHKHKSSTDEGET